MHTNDRGACLQHDRGHECKAPGYRSHKPHPHQVSGTFQNKMVVPCSTMNVHFRIQKAVSQVAPSRLTTDSRQHSTTQPPACDCKYLKIRVSVLVFVTRSTSSVFKAQGCVSTEITGCITLCAHLLRNLRPTRETARVMSEACDNCKLQKRC